MRFTRSAWCGLTNYFNATVCVHFPKTKESGFEMSEWTAWPSFYLLLAHVRWTRFGFPFISANLNNAMSKANVSRESTTSKWTALVHNLYIHVWICKCIHNCSITTTNDWCKIINQRMANNTFVRLAGGIPVNPPCTASQAYKSPWSALQLKHSLMTLLIEVWPLFSQNLF